MIYLKYLKLMIKSCLQYRASLWIGVAAQFFQSFFSFLGIYLLFERFGTIKGWAFTEVAICFAITQMSFAIAQCFSRGFDVFSKLIVSGDFDRFFLRPQGLGLQVMGSNFDLIRLGRFLQSIIVFIIIIPYSQISWSLERIVTAFLMILSGTFIYAGIFILGAAFCFVTIDGIEIVNVLTDIGKELAAYPLDIYKNGIKLFFTFVIPFGLVNYLPLNFLVGKSQDSRLMFLPLAGMFFIIPCYYIWQVSMNKYVGTGS